MSLGALGYVGYGVESTEGTQVAPTKFLPVSSFSFEDSDDLMAPSQIRGSRDKSVALAAPYNVSGTMEMEFVPLDIAPLLKSAFACIPVTSSYAGGGYQHVYTPANEEPTFSFESSAAGILVMRYGGVRVNTLNIKSAFGEIVTASFGLEGLNRAKQGSAATPSYASTLPFHFSGAEVKVGGAAIANVKDFEFGVNNNLERIGTLRKTRGWKRMAPGEREVTLALTLDFTDTAEYDRFLAGTSFAVQLWLEAAPGTGMAANKTLFFIDIPQVLWTKVGVPLSAGDFLEQSVEATITKGAGAIFTATLINSEQTVA